MKENILNNKKTLKNKLFLALVLAVFIVAPLHNSARAELRIDVSGGHVEPLPTAIPDFIGNTLEDYRYGQQIASVIAADLNRSGLFRIMNKQAFIEKFTSIDVQPTFRDWKAINTQALLQGKISSTADGQLRIEFRLWDVFARQQLEGRALISDKDNWRRISHVISDIIYERITGEKGYFDTRIVYIAESGSQVNKVKRLAIMDQDGANHKYLTNGNELVLTPRFSPTMQEITYLSYRGDTPQVYLFNIESGHNRVLGSFPGMTFAPRFSPDGRKVIMSMSVNGNSEIYTMDLATKAVRQITRHPAIDTSPSYSPDGRQIVFNSDRGGTQQLYVMNADGSNANRISFGDGRYATPVWSPRGDYIAFTKMKGGQFYIGIMFPDGTGERLVAKGYMVESPTWSPNGRVLMYYKQGPSNRQGYGANPRLYTVDITGYNERQVLTPGDATDPAWSPLLP